MIRKLMRPLTLPEASQDKVAAEKVVNVDPEVTAEAMIAEVVTAEVVTKESAMIPEVATEENAEAVTKETALNVEEASAEVEIAVNADPKVKLVRIKSTVEIVLGPQDLPDQRVETILDKIGKTIMVKEEEVVPAATEVASEVAVVDSIS
jgi:hypothetical protein